MITEPVLLDTGPLVALLHEQDAAHERCREQADEIRGQVFTTWPVMTEAAWLLRKLPEGLERLLSVLIERDVVCKQLEPDAMSWMSAAVRKYHNLSPQLADDVAALSRRAAPTTLRLYARPPRLHSLSSSEWQTIRSASDKSLTTRARLLQPAAIAFSSKCDVAGLFEVRADRALRRRGLISIFLVHLLAVFIVTGCTRAENAVQLPDQRHSQRASTSTVSQKPSECGAAERDLINDLIDSLANKNPEPRWVADTVTPLFSEGYDWQEDQRVFKVLKQLDEQDKECLFHCVMEHLDDNRYCLAFNFNGNNHIGSIASFCHSSAAGQLAAAFMGGPGAHMPHQLFHWRMIGPDDNWTAWRRGHKNVPLYKQQIEMCEVAIKDISTDSYISKYIPQAETMEYVAFIKKQIEKLEGEKKPMFRTFGTMSWAIEGLNGAEKAKKTRARYPEPNR